MPTLTHSLNPEYTGRGPLNSLGNGFKDPASMFLHGIEGVRWALANLSEWSKKHGCDKPHPFEFSVVSDWLIELIDEYQATGKYPYNADIIILAQERLGIPVQSYKDASREGTPLSLLVYNAQGYRRDAKLREAGLLPLTQEMLDEAARTKKQIELADGTRCNVRNVEGKNYAFKPRKRNYAVALYAPAKIVARKSRTKQTA